MKQAKFDTVFSIAKSEINYSQGPKYNHITCLGEVQNNTNDLWNNFVFEVSYFGSNGSLIDTVTENLYDNVLNPRDKMSFRIRALADKERSSYSRHAVRITWADNESKQAERAAAKKKIMVCECPSQLDTDADTGRGLDFFYLLVFCEEKVSPTRSCSNNEGSGPAH